MDWLRKIRNNLGKSMADVAREAGISEGYYCQIENAKRGVPVPTAKRIAAALGFAWQRFYEE